MSRTRTVRCGYCGLRGHNRRSCKELTEAFKRQYQSRPTELFRHELIKRTGIDPKTGNKVTAERERKRTVKKPRKCSYCQHYGHSRATCKNIANDMEIWIEAVKIRRSNTVHRLKQVGVGVGSLVTDSAFKCSGLVTEIKWWSIERPESEYGHCDATIIQPLTPTEIAQGHHSWSYKMHALTLNKIEKVVSVKQQSNKTWWNCISIAPSGAKSVKPPANYIDGYTITKADFLRLSTHNGKARSYKFAFKVVEGASLGRIRERLKLPIDAYG